MVMAVHPNNVTMTMMVSSIISTYVVQPLQEHQSTLMDVRIIRKMMMEMVSRTMSTFALVQNQSASLM
jgi:hypothetical protein